ncbi:hypothetical protein FSP39_024562 [Pinctada imbricata]|uniref:Sacsin/Nov domain-containing protein n=1 Tax=Pinctada imbricata TaxID=66713 RepID=A0AA88YUE9_PINIB|nr:hypothetical protein FSP39_024562 [Pinctada imbricata]
MTDTPIIISGDRLLMISPLEDQSWKVCHTIQLKKVFNKRKYHKLKEMLDQILGPENALFGIMEESFRKGNYKGTLFWFPLRQSIPIEDPISRTIYTQNKVDDLFHSFHREASMVLLFLKHVEQISLHTLEENSTFHEMFSVEIKSCNNENISKERRKISDRLKSCPQNHVVQKSIDSVFQARILLREESRSQETHWLISTVYQGSDEMSDEMRSLLDNNELRYQPYVGVALPFDRGGFSPHVFCFLPLPLEKVGQSLTNLPFHVNGSFALDSNRRHMNWPTNDRTEDKDVSLKWNRLMITEVLPTAYVNLMTNMVVTSHVQKGMIYKAMPDPEAVDKKWAILLPKLFSRLFEEPIFSTESGQHINFSEAVFSIISTTGNIGQCHTKNLLDTVQMYCPYLVRIPSEESHVFQILQSPYTPSSPKVITPKYINQLLLQDHEGKYKELSREHKLTLLVFLTSEGNFDYVDSLELMPVDSREKEFKVFERANTGKATYFLATQEQKEVLPELEDILLTPCDLKMPEAETVIETLSKEDLLIFAENLKDLQICSISGNDADTQNKTDLYHANSQTLHTVVKDDSLLEEKSINVQNNCREVNIQAKRQHCATTWLVSKCGKGSVAILKENDDDIAMGFDKHHTPGKVFNIFPLDEMTDLPIYINGNFELLDHKIDRSTSVAVEGSKKILRTDVASSYVFLINHLCSYPVLSETNLFSLWPRYSNDNVFDEVVRAFYDNIFHSNIELFTCKTGRQGLQQVCFLDFELRYKEPIGEIAQACFSELYNEPGKQNIDIPKSIHEQFETTNLVSRLHILQEEEFWTEVFLPSLSTNYWDQKQSQRNKLIAYCIQRSINLNLTSIIQKTWCVPTSPNGKLARPCDLVHLKPGSVLNGLFSEKDGRFVQDLDEFNSKEMREQLFRLGMMMETIHEDVLKERANSVATLYSSDPTESESRYSALLAYLKSLKNEEFAQAISAIRTIAWIPTAQTFSPYPSSAKWYGEESTHCNMDEGYLFKHRYLVGAIAYVYRDDKVLESLISRQPGEREVIDNLLRVIGDFNEDKYERGYDEIVHEAYSFFTKLNDISSDSINRLKLQKCVWTGHKFVLPAKVCLEFCLGIKKESLVPFMYCFDNQFEGIKWNPFFQTIGCHERLTVEHILQILESTNDVLQLHETGQEDLDNLLDVVLAILDTISKTELSKDHKDRLMLPVKFQNSWKMCKLLECAYISDESHLLMATSDDDANILVGKIGIETAEQLGVQSLSQRLLKDNDAEEMFCDWGQSEPLTTRIKRLLEEYSDGFSIPKELLQNADDAGATELTFIYDERENNDLRTGLLDEGMAECQGPALWVYSNSLFEEADFQNIIKLDGKTKVEETSKIGKFGLGFCSVYNITDVPSFVSGKSIVIFDPNTFHLGKAIRDKSSPGLRIKFTKGSKEFLKRFRNQFMPYNGICECDLSGEDDVPFFNGTLFRFPFRTKLQASKSEIADRPYKQSDVKELLHQFIASAGNLLLFTPNVHTIKVKHITEKAGTQNISDLCDIRKENVSNRPERPFLSEVAQMDNDYLKENTAKEICEVHISLQTTEHAKNVLEMSEINSSCNWLISYSSGSRDSIQMAENLSSEGAVSVGSVAIPREYLLSNDDYSLNGALRGFYKESHIFCFLPLPIETNLPVHINGSFFVEQSRRGLRQCAGTDNKSTKDVDRWNEMLLSDAVCDSYLGLLQALPSDYYSNENGLPRDSNFDYSRFWPALFEDSVLRPLSQNFYEQVVKGDHQLLYSQIPFDTKIAMKNCIFLEANVRYDQSIGDVAFECLQNFHSEEDYCLMDMKKSIYDRFCEAGLKGSLRFLSTRDFFATVVLPNLTNEFWTNRETERDKMMVFLLKFIQVEEMPDLSNAMKQFDCIPTRPHGKLVKPHDLVNENSRLIVDLFSDDDERFIQYDRNHDFKDDVVQTNLIVMGMMTNSISDDLIVSRAESIQQFSDSKRRCEAFIRYLESLADQHLQNLEFRLKNVAWIPVIEDKPFDYPSCLKWNGQSVKLQCPSNVYSEKYRHIVGSCANIHDKDIAELLQRMNFSQKPSVKLVLEHFRAMISLDDVTECNKLTQSVHDVYKYLYENLDDLQTNDTFDEDLYPEPLVWTGNMFIEAKHVCCQFCLGIARTALEPYIYKLVDEFTYMKPLFVFFGCSAELSFDHLLEIQKQINTKNNNADAEEDRRVMLNIVTDIAFKFKPDRHEDLKQLQLPVIHGEDRELKLASVTECVFTTDNFFLNNAEESAQQIHIMDRRIGIEVAEKLGVESLASRIMKDNDAEELGEEWGQSEPLTTRLKGLLEDYNDGFAIPKELVQNSDDAGATTVRFLYDERTNDEYMTGLIDEGMSECQGPALWVFNDACFTEDDFKNIIKLAGKTKESERSKIGKFGLGFSSVYNLTDVPSFVSGNSVVILDPKTVHLNKALRNKSSPGIRLRFGQQNQWLLKKLKNQFMPFQNIFGCDMSGTNNEPLDFKGTLFRLPLRTRKQAQDDAISSQAYSKKEMIKLLQKFASSVGTLMTFTQNIHKIEVYRLPETAAEPGESVLLFEASREKIGGTGRFNMLQEIVDECLKSHSSSRKTSVEVEMNIRTTRAASELLGVETDSWKYRWFITTSTGSMETLQMAKELSDKGAVPIGSVAISDAHIKSCSKLKEEPMGFEGNNRLFCFLPLPISKITLSVFVNGCFFVEKNRKCLHLPIGDDRMSHDKELEWNQTLLSDAVRDAYISLIAEIPMEYFEQDADGNALYQIWPRFSDNREIFEPLTREFYQSITSYAADKRIFEIQNQKIGMNQCIFLDFSLRYKEFIGNAAHDFLVYLDTPTLKTVIDMPQEIYEQFKEASCDDKLPMLTTLEFFSAYFFENINSDFWNGKESSRNSLVLYALSEFSENADLLAKISVAPCIPTRPHGLLRRPSELISEVHCSVLKDLFSEADERFIQSSDSQHFSDSKIMDVLVRLGLKTDFLPKELLCERAESVIKQGTPDKQISRCEAVLQYIQKHANTDLPYTDMKSIKFLPVQEKPENWPMKWHSAQEIDTGDQGNFKIQFEKPENIASQYLKCIVGSVLPILQMSLESKFSHNVFLQLGLKTRGKLSIDDAIGQLRHISETSPSSVEERIMKEICEETYSFIGENIMEYQDVDLSEFKERKMIYAGNKLVKPRECIIWLPVECQPEFYCMKNVWSTTSSELLTFLRSAGVRDLENTEDEKCLNINDILGVLKKFEINIGNRVEENVVILIINLLTTLDHLAKQDRNYHLPNEVIEQLFAPDMNNIIRRPTDICIDDNYDKLSDEPNLHIVHDKMTRGLLRLLKIKTKRAQYISQFDFGVSFGQEEKLTTRIRGILEDHPSEISVFNELLQNADDAFCD